MEDKKTKKLKIPAGITVHNVLTVIGITITVILIPILLLNMILIVKGTANSDKPPSVFGVTPLVVLSGSMDDGSYGAIAIGDLILVKDVDATNLKENEVVAFMEDGYAVTHRIVAVHDDNGKVTYTTRGDANNTDDTMPLEPDNVIGQYFYRVPKVGNFILYLQTTTGMLLFVGLPILLFIAYDMIRRHMFTKSEQAKQEQLRKELEELKRRPSQANAYKPVQGQVLKQPNSPPAQQLNYQKPLPPLPPEVQPMPIQQAQPPVPPQRPTQARPPVAPPPPPPAAPRPQPASPLPPAQQQPARPPRQAPSIPTSASKAPTQAKSVAKKATVQIKKSTKPRK